MKLRSDAREGRVRVRDPAWIDDPNDTEPDRDALLDCHSNECADGEAAGKREHRRGIAQVFNHTADRENPDQYFDKSECRRGNAQ